MEHVLRYESLNMDNYDLASTNNNMYPVLVWTNARIVKL